MRILTGRTRPVSFLLLIAALPLAVIAGPLTPPAGPVADTGRFGPRVDVNTLPSGFGYTHVIDKPGSYYLSGDINALLAGGIWISSSDVKLDLNGFSINGDFTAGFSGIFFNAPYNSVHIANGTVQKFAFAGIVLNGSSHYVDRMTVFLNQGDGIFGNTAQAVIISDSHVISNGGGGGALGAIFLGNNCLVRGTIVHSNEMSGIIVNQSSAVENCVSNQNMGNGIQGLAGFIRITDCTAMGNTTDISTANSLINGCMAGGIVGAGNTVVNGIP